MRQHLEVSVLLLPLAAAVTARRNSGCGLRSQRPSCRMMLPGPRQHRSGWLRAADGAELCASEGGAG